MCDYRKKWNWLGIYSEIATNVLIRVIHEFIATTGRADPYYA